MLNFLRLTRPLNLLIIAATMLLMRVGVIGGNLERGVQQLLVQLEGTVQRDDVMLPDGFGPQMPWGLFLLLIVSTMLVAAGGNVINDYFDTRIDRINKPGEVIVGRTVKRRVAMTGHLVLSGLGLLCGAFVAWRSGMIQWAMIPAFAIGALWSYSTTFKRRLIIGNGLVATLTALVPLTVGLYEIPLLQRAFATPQVATLPGNVQFLMEPAFHELWYWILVYAAFAFLSTLVRELQKDMADIKGDAADGCRTIPIVWGIAWARGLSMTYIALIIAGLLVIRSQFLNDALSFWAIGLGIIVPLLLSAGFTFQAQQRSEFVRAGNLMKVAMVAAVAFALFIRYIP